MAFRILSYLFFKILLIYLRERNEGEREGERASKHIAREEAEEEAGSLLSQEPDVGLDLRTLGS